MSKDTKPILLQDLKYNQFLVLNKGNEGFAQANLQLYQLYNSSQTLPSFIFSTTQKMHTYSAGAT